MKCVVLVYGVELASLGWNVAMALVYCLYGAGSPGLRNACDLCNYSLLKERERERERYIYI